jgi:hypothetical protein
MFIAKEYSKLLGHTELDFEQLSQHLKTNNIDTYRLSDTNDINKNTKTQTVEVKQKKFSNKLDNSNKSKSNDKQKNTINKQASQQTEDENSSDSDSEIEGHYSIEEEEFFSKKNRLYATFYLKDCLESFLDF